MNYKSENLYLLKKIYFKLYVHLTVFCIFFQNLKLLIWSLHLLRLLGITSQLVNKRILR